MASPFTAGLCALIATAFWALLGYALARHLLPRVLAIGAAMVTGWAVHSAVALPVYRLLGFSPFDVVGVSAICILIAGVSLSQRAPASAIDSDLTIPPWAFAAAAILALIPAAAIMPKFSGGAVALSDPIFDHAKIAIIDAIARLGLPPVDPVFGDAPGRLAYYYLWHFSAAELALVTRASGWEADIALTWFTAFASLGLMMGLAVWLSKKSAAALWTVALAAAGSVWTTLYFFISANRLAPVLLPPIGMAGWRFQADWVPQHLMAAGCTVTAMLLIARYATRPSLTLVLTIALLIVAGFESSTFVGGVTFALAAIIAAPLVFTAVDPPRRWRFVGGMAIAAVLVIVLIAPFVLDQIAAVQARGGGSPIVVSHYRVFGELLPHTLRRILDIPGYWLIILPAELPAAYVAGVIALVAILGAPMPRAEKLAAAMLACLAGTGLVVSWLLVSTLGQNNDLGLRAIIPVAMVLIVAAAAGAAGLPSKSRRVPVIATALIGLLLGVPDIAETIRDNFLGNDTRGGEVFTHTPELWTAVRRHTPVAARVANNPQFLQHLTPWPVNISWALLSDRSSCFAGREMALAFAPLTTAKRDALSYQFARVFDGNGTLDDLHNDVHEMAAKYGCDVVVVVPTDKIWTDDPFASSPDYRLAEARDGHWRIYVKAK